jgi:hypothetical protein
MLVLSVLVVCRTGLTLMATKTGSATARADHSG